MGTTVGELIAGAGNSTTRYEPAEGTPSGLGRSIVQLLEGDVEKWHRGVRDRVYSVGTGGRALTVADWSLVQPLDGPAKLF